MVDNGPVVCRNTSNILADALHKLAADNNAQYTISIVLGVLPIVLALVGLTIAYLQPRRGPAVIDLESLGFLGKRQYIGTEDEHDSNRIQ